MTGRRWGESTAVPSVEQAGIQGWGMLAGAWRRGVGGRGFVSSAGLQPMPNGIPLCAQLSPPCCVESAQPGIC